MATFSETSLINVHLLPLSSIACKGIHFVLSWLLIDELILTIGAQYMSALNIAMVLLMKTYI